MPGQTSTGSVIYSASNRAKISALAAHRSSPQHGLLIACLALLAQTLVGIMAEECELHRHYQANTVRTRRVLSFFVLGGFVLASKKADELLARLKPDRFEPLRARVANYQCCER